jgi:hypothetical protein
MDAVCVHDVEGLGGEFHEIRGCAFTMYILE